MDFASALKPDIYRIVVINLVPGFVGVAPWVGCVFWPSLQDTSTWGSEGVIVPISVTLAAIVLAAGLVLEDLGSRVEIYWADEWLSKRCRRMAAGWRVYLAQKRDNDLIAQGYLRAVLLRFKFELSMIPALATSALGLIAGQLGGHGFGNVQTLLMVVVQLVLLGLLLDEVRKGAVVLARTRRVIIRAAKLVVGPRPRDSSGQGGD